MKYSQKEMIKKLNENNFNFKKKFGQNFIIDSNIINKIVDNSNIDNNTMVIEIGPGAGSLTYKLVSIAKFVLCYEIDKDIKEVLKSNLKDYDNYDIIFDDFLKRDIKLDLEKYKYDKLMIIANLPYYITTPIIIKIIEENIDVDKMVFMVQKEVGDRFKAKEGSKDYNSLSIFLNYYFDIKKVTDVSRNVFIPVPNVDSIVVEFRKKEKHDDVYNLDLFFKLVKDSFKQKRKTLKNNLKEYNLEVINRVLNIYGYNLSDRAEKIPMKVFIEMANELENEQKCA